MREESLSLLRLLLRKTRKCLLLRIIYLGFTGEFCDRCAYIASHFCHQGMFEKLA